jgi:hypothetical protein
MTLAELKTKTLAEILQEKDLCLIVLKEDAFAKIQDNLGRLSFDHQEQLKTMILNALTQVLMIQQKAKRDMEEKTQEAIQYIDHVYAQAKQDAYLSAEIDQRSQDKKEADHIISDI